MRRNEILTDILIAINVLVAAVGLLRAFRDSGSVQSVLLSGGGDPMIYRFGLIPGYVRQGQWYRLVTSMFVHSGLMHLLFNMSALYNCGRILEGRCGTFKMGLIYVVSGLCGGLLVMLLTRNSNTVTVGASGAIFGVMAACFVLALKLHARSAWKAMGTTLLINVVLTFSNPSISVGGHIGGLVSGLILGLLLCR